MIKSLTLALGLLVGVMGIANAGSGFFIEEAQAGETTAYQIFHETEGKLIDWAILSAVETGYYRDLINGRSMVGGQFPIVYVTPYVSADFGYVAPYEEADRGSLMVGGTIRINKLIEYNFPNQMAALKYFLPAALDPAKLWFGPWIAHRFTTDELSAGIKAGYRF